MDGSSRPASELAGYAGIGGPAASEHLALLLDTGLLTCSTRGRQRYYRIADSDVAAALEKVGHLCPAAPARTWQRSREARDLAEARLCYDHLAGRLGVNLAGALAARGWLDEDLHITAAGREGLTGYGIDLAALQQRRRPISRPCPDWTERRHHIAGSLGAALATHWFDHRWIRHRPNGRGLDLPDTGRDELRLLNAGH